MLLLAPSRVFEMALLCPNNGLPVAPGDHEQAFARGVPAKIGCTQHPPIQLIPQLLEHFGKAPPGAPLPCWVWDQVLILHPHPLARFRHQPNGFAGIIHTALQAAPGLGVSLGNQRAPFQHLFDVFHTDHVWAHLPSPADQHPGQPANLLAARLSARCLAVVRAIWAAVQPAYRLPARYRARVNFKHIRHQVAGMGVVDSMHAQRIVVVVHRDIRAAAPGHFHGARHPAATREQVNDQLFVQG